MSTTEEIELDPETGEPGRGPWRWVTWIAIAVVAVVALGYGAIFFYANVINDAPDELDAGDLSERLVETTVPADDAGEPPVTAPPVTTAVEAPVTTAAPATTAVDTAAPTAPASYDGDWAPTAASEFGYRVDEVLAGVNTTAVGRGNDITGLLTIEGTTATSIDVTIDVATITSDDGRRDGQFRGRIMETGEFPTATFSLTRPIDFGAIPDEGEQITATATGDLTLHGVTREVTFDLTAEATGERIGVFGNIAVLFSDYGIDNPSFGAIKTEDNGLLEFVLVFERA